MRFMLSFGTTLDNTENRIRFLGRKTSFDAVRAGSMWCADNEQFSGSVHYSKVLGWLENSMSPYRDTCKFVVAPDILGNAIQTRDEFYQWYDKIKGWPLAFVAQDGQENIDLPDPSLWCTLFIGGTTEFKLSSSALDLIREGERLKKSVHIGRINSYKRFKYFNEHDAKDAWTCDGTKQRWIGVEKTLELYLNWERKFFGD